MPSTSNSTNNTTANTYVLTASIAADGSLQLSSPDLQNNVIETPRGQDAVVIINDIEGQYLYGTEVPIRGEDTSGWPRDTAKGLTERVFPAVESDLVNIVFAAETNNNGKIKYGPVITIKPKG
ncbi:hypothetical protein [Enhygromyxa salina]|nr:hypothetical protein [Enhygromyxa salina]